MCFTAENNVMDLGIGMNEVNENILLCIASNFRCKTKNIFKFILLFWVEEIVSLWKLQVNTIRLNSCIHRHTHIHYIQIHANPTNTIR